MNPRNININCFAGWKTPENFQKKYQKIENIYKYFMKVIQSFFIC